MLLLMALRLVVMGQEGDQKLLQLCESWPRWVTSDV